MAWAAAMHLAAKRVAVLQPGMLSSNRRGAPVAADKRGGSGSPWSIPPSGNRQGGKPGGKQGKSGSGGGGAKRSSNSSSSSSSGSGNGSGRSKGKSASKNNVDSNAVGGSYGPPPLDAAPSPLQQHKLTPPLTPQLLDELSDWDVLPAPLWGTFTGHCEGEWLGQYSAYTPWGGDPEPVWADESGAYLLHAYSRASEERRLVPLQGKGRDSNGPNGSDVDTGADLLVRTTLRSASIGSLTGGIAPAPATAAVGADASTGASSAAPAAAGGADAAAEDEEWEGFGYNTDGSAVFNGGSYSAGPPLIGSAAAEEEELSSADDGGSQQQLPPPATVVLEQALVSGGDTRLRLVATLKLQQLDGQELDVEVARLLLYKEHWYGTATSTSGTLVRNKAALLERGAASAPAAIAVPPSAAGESRALQLQLQLLSAHQFDVPVTQALRPQPDELAGSWNVFVVAANPVVEENPETLQEEQVLVYSGREERQQWHVPGLTSSAALGDAMPEPIIRPGAETLDDDGSGGSFWLPGGAVATFRMVPLPAASSSSDSNDRTAAYVDDYDDRGTPATGSSTGVVKDNDSTAAHTDVAAPQRRGLLCALHWLTDTGCCLYLERQYDADGVLVEVRHGSAVKGGWSGGRM